MVNTYCPNKLPGNAHTCLCTALAHHPGGHKCACGHTWGDPWHTMTYDQQRAWLGLPAPPQWVPSYMDVACAISGAYQLLGDLIGVEINPGEFDFSELGREAVQAYLEIRKEAS
ncbi:hypothetical protein K3M35_05200 [Rhodococcus sp. DMU2021]|uniref:hypothetical protein n=1 Tax=Rhodococcus sp. DMU2021 TaxID=2866997 RepID=UPI001C7D679C|nr:hypothetical protein [Rhodococcus sp. DMU2021]MBX4168063.1 hypothetical protein [Rhodococcus sp. DMU2021]